MSRRAALTGALLITLASPATWPLALAAFLLRGGIILAALPILVLPTPVGLGNILAPSLTSIVYGNVTPGTVVVGATIALGGLVLVVAAALLAALLEAEAARLVTMMGNRPRHPAPAGRWATAGRVVAARALAHLPFGLVLAWGVTRLVAAAYHELTNPSDMAVPLVWRVLRAAPEAVAACLLAWIVGQAIGAIAARRIAIGRRGTWRALGDAISICLRRPLTVVVDFTVPTLALGLVLAPSAFSAAPAATLIRAAAMSPGDPLGLGLAVVLFVSLWVVGLALTAVVCAWRAAVWTVRLGEDPP